MKKRLSEYVTKNPSATLIRLDQSLMNMPLPTAVREGMQNAIEEISHPYGVRLSSPWSGYLSLKKAVAAFYAKHFGVSLAENEIFITSGLESAQSCLSALFGADNTVLMTDPCDQRVPHLNLCSGRTLSFVHATPENNFIPEPAGDEVDLIYLSSPNPVTGVAMSHEQLKKWVDFATEKDSVIFFDSSLSEYLDESMPRSIYQIEGAKNCAVEIFSFEKGFGVKELKCAFVVIPHTLMRKQTRLNAYFSLRQPITATPPSFVMQRAAELLLSPEAMEDTKKILNRIRKVALLLEKGLAEAGIPSVGAATSPYLWAQCPQGMTSWQCFDRLLEGAGCVVTPGSLFGYAGERFFRITSFGMPEEAEEAVAKIRALFAETPASAPEDDKSAERTAAMLFSEE